MITADEARRRASVASALADRAYDRAVQAAGGPLLQADNYDQGCIRQVEALKAELEREAHMRQADVRRLTFERDHAQHALDVIREITEGEAA